ncbi:ATP-binding protein [Flavobacteriaceae bacterium KMM 6898]|nr:ATP-binding protein [Flavobacteriaceae bacterium KMM 6898]
MRFDKKIYSNLIGALGLLLLLTIFIIDLLTPLGIADGMLYVGVILLSKWSNDRKIFIITTITAIVLIIVGYSLSPSAPLGIPSYIAITNRCFSIIVVLICAFMIIKQNLLEQKLIEAKMLAEAAQEKAESAMKAKQQFLANMSHEIRTPMTAIIGFSKVALKTELTKKQREYISAIKTSSDSLMVLINDILDLAKVDSGEMCFEQTAFEMEPDISAMLSLFDLKFKEKNLELIREYDSEIPRVLLGDSVRLNQIILNLISNAIKFTAKGKITVSVRLLETDEDKVTIEFAVADTGIGLAEDMVSTVFDNFQQATSSTARLYGGTGLGLAIVKQLVERQGGTINVKSKIDEGSTFSFVLSFQKTKTKIELDSEMVKLNTAIQNIKVLVVEDVALNQLLMKILMDDFGFELDIAENGKVAIENLQTTSYDIILMDLQMPEMNGFEATDYIRNKMKSNIPIIALTADVSENDLAQCKAIGMNDHIAKPIDEKLLYNKIIGLVIKA